MNQNNIPDNLCRTLSRIGQTHILRFFNELSEEQKKNLLAQVSKLEFEKIPLWVEKYIKNNSPTVLPDHFEPAPSYPAIPKTPEMSQKYARAKELGEQLVRQGRVAGFVVAGGQGTRLGYDGPKGNYPISPIKNKTLFQIFAETILAVSEKYGITIPFYIMTSPLNYDATVGIFESADWYGLSRDDVFIFQQGTLPNFSFDGKILLASKDQIASSPDGHGGSLKALYVSGAVADMKKRGIEILSY